MILIIDNYDSFTYNLVHYLGELGAEVHVAFNDAITLTDIVNLAPSHIFISPGPCAPDQAGVSLAVIKRFAGQIPILGVCLGHQSIGQAFGGKVVRAQTPMHGKTSLIHHDAKHLFAQLETPYSATRYHSLVLDPASLPECLRISAWTEDAAGNRDEIMAVEHQQWPVYGVQFHPEAILTAHGHRLLQNFVELTL